MLNPHETALVLIGYQNDYFSKSGVLYDVIEQSAENVLRNTIELVDSLANSGVLMLDLPISFTPDYSELSENAEGILSVIRERKAFQADQEGSLVVPEIERYRDNLVKIPGKRGLNGFSNTGLDDYLKEHNIKNIILAGAVTSVCIDSTGRAATERGYKVTVVGSCTSARSEIEQSFYCDSIFPIYATVADHASLISSIKDAA